MIDREKVIKGLHSCFENADCDGCPYELECRRISFKTQENHCPILDDILELLEEQEASWIRAPYKKARFCSRCYADEPYKFADEDANVYDYCPNCGARMINRR